MIGYEETGSATIAGVHAWRRWLPRTRLGWAACYTTAVFVLCILLQPIGSFWTPDGGAKFMQLLYLHRTGAGFSAAVPYLARDVDPDLRLVDMPFSFRLYPDGQFHTYFPLVFALVSRVPYLLFGLRGLLLLPAAAGASSALLSGLIAERLRPGRGWIALLLAAFATPIFFYSQIFWEHTPAVALALAGLYLLVRETTTAREIEPESKVTAGQRLARLGRYLAALALIALAAAFRSEMLLFEGCCAAWCAVRIFQHEGLAGRAALAVVAAAGFGMVVLVITTTSQSGDLIGAKEDVQLRVLGHLFDPAQRASILTDLGHRLRDVFYNIVDADAVVVPLLAYPALLAALAALAAGLSRGRWKWRLLVLASAAMAAPAAVNAFYPGPMSSTHGVVLSAPFILAAVALLGPKRPAGMLMVATMLVFVLAEVAFWDRGTAGGREWGARGILLIYPLAAVLLAVNWPLDRQSTIRRVAVGALVVLSVFTQLRGVFQMRVDVAISAPWTTALQQLSPSVVATDVWWLASTNTPAYPRHRFVLLPQGPDQPQLAEYLYRQVKAGPGDLAWVSGCFDRCSLPPALQPYFVERSSSQVRGMWFVTLTPRGSPPPASA